MAAEASPPPLRIVVLCLAFVIAAMALFLAGPLAERGSAQDGAGLGNGCPSEDPTVYCGPIESAPDDDPPAEPEGENPLGEGTHEDPNAPLAPDDYQPEDSPSPEGTVEVNGETASDDTLIVTYEEDATVAEQEEAKDEVSAETDYEVPEIDAEIVEVPEAATGKQLETTKEELEADPAVETVDYDGTMELAWSPNDPTFRQGGQGNLTAVDALRAWNVHRGAGARIAIIDSGCFRAHNDIGAKVVKQHDFFNQDLYANDPIGHGTHVASTAAARTNNGLGIAGGAPGAHLICARITDNQGYTNASLMLKGLRWALNNNADVVNLSFGGGAYNQSLANMMKILYNQGVFVAGAAGNNNQNKTADYPSAYDTVMAVGGTTRHGTEKYYDPPFGSNCGPYVDISAPGESIWGAGIKSRNYYFPNSGTSMASPHVAAAAALLIANGVPPERVHYRLQSTADDRGPAGRDTCFGAGLVDYHGALTLTD